MPARSAALEPKQDRSRATRRRLLDAAVEELLEGGYAELTIQGVARRAGVSRGAAQNHFPQRSTLLGEAVRHLGARHIAELRSIVGNAPPGAARLRAALDKVFEQYRSGHFAAIIELSLAARQDPELRAVVSAEERAIGSEVNDVAVALFGRAGAKRKAKRWATALSTVRGVALLGILGHPAPAVDRQWQSTRRDVLALLTADDD